MKKILPDTNLASIDEHMTDEEIISGLNKIQGLAISKEWMDVLSIAYHAEQRINELTESSWVS